MDAEDNERTTSVTNSEPEANGLRVPVKPSGLCSVMARGIVRMKMEYGMFGMKI